MQTKEFYAFISKLLITGTAVIVFFSFLVYQRGPVIRLVDFDADIGNISLTNNHSMTLYFDRPIDQTDFSDAVRIRPKVNIETVSTKQSLIVSFRESLKSDTTYQLTVDPIAKDSAGKVMKSAFNYEFKTGPAKYAFLQRNYDTEPDSNEDALDHIILGAVGSDDQEILYSAPEIRSFVINRNYAAVAVAEEDADELVVVDLETREITKPRLLNSGAVNNLTLSEFGETVLYADQLDHLEVSPDHFQNFSDRLYALDLSSGKTKALTDSSGDIFQVFSISINRDGQMALVRDNTGSYFAISPFNDYDPVLLGAHSSDFGFNEDGTEIAFRDDKAISSFSLVDSELTEHDFFNQDFLRDLMWSNGKLFFTFNVVDFDLDTGDFDSSTQIRSATEWGQDFETIWREAPGNGYSVGNTSVSYGADLLAVNFNRDGCKFDEISGNNHCADTRTDIYDIETNKQLTTIDGFDLTWIP